MLPRRFQAWRENLRIRFLSILAGEIYLYRCIVNRYGDLPIPREQAEQGLHIQLHINTHIKDLLVNHEVLRHMFLETYSGGFVLFIFVRVGEDDAHTGQAQHMTIIIEVYSRNSRINDLT